LSAFIITWMHLALFEVTTTECMVRYRLAIGAVLMVCYEIIYLGLRFSTLRTKVDNGELYDQTRNFNVVYH
jgi:hypothetical protein